LEGKRRLYGIIEMGKEKQERGGKEVIFLSRKVRDEKGQRGGRAVVTQDRKRGRDYEKKEEGRPAL